MEWIDFKKCPPKKEGHYLVWYKGGKYHYSGESFNGHWTGAYWRNEQWKDDSSDHGLTNHGLTHYAKVEGPTTQE